MADFLNHLRIFVRVVEAGSFTAVAKENDSTAAQISRAVSSLEEELQAVERLQEECRRAREQARGAEEQPH